jgi:Fe2+ or Zn2+ uptake regulation protein
VSASKRIQTCYLIADVMRRGTSYTPSMILDHILDNSMTFPRYVYSALSMLSSKKLLRKVKIDSTHATYEMVMSRQELRDILNSMNHREYSLRTTEQSSLDINSIEVRVLQAKVEELEGKLNILAAAFCSVGRNVEAVFAA